MTPQARIVGLTSMATKYVLAELALEYERRTGTPVTCEFAAGVEAARRVERREPLDFVVLAADAIDRLAAKGVLSGSRVDIAASGVAVAVKKGARAPDIGSEAAVRDAVARARTVGYSTGPSGVYLLQLFERWGIAETVKARLVQAPPGVPVGAMIEAGEVDLGFQQLSELIHVPGIRVVGALPDAIQITTTFSGAVCATSSRPEATREWLMFAASPEATPAKARNGMQFPRFS
ncbi:MAG TPA: substrate-binding domain-containing protein [Usitatibacter sp.]|nr:substrate-binding domain-containing protein [Usitatibacter sp.]